MMFDNIKGESTVYDGLIVWSKDQGNHLSPYLHKLTAIISMVYGADAILVYGCQKSACGR